MKHVVVVNAIRGKKALKKKIVVLGAGYGGLMTVTRLQKQIKAQEAEIILINKHHYHYETTWLHEVSAGTLEPERVRYDIKRVLNRNKVTFIEGEVQVIKKDEHKVILDQGEITYNYLVVALGSNSETFGIEGLKDYGLAITDVNAARRIREHIEQQFAMYTKEQNEKYVTIVVGGAGFTGIEFLGELTNQIPNLCEKYNIPQENIRIICVEAGSVLLPQFDRELADYALSYLEHKGVQFYLGTMVQKALKDGVIIGKKNGEEEPYKIEAGTLIWSAGVRGNSVIVNSGFEHIRGRVEVNSDLTVPGYPNIFMIGDCSYIINKENNRPYPPTAQIAMQQGVTCARNLVKLVKGQVDLDAFVFDDKGTVCSLGEDNAIGVVYGKKLKGTTASVMKKVVDDRALFLIGGTSLVLKKGKFKFFS